jgi:hypothetical protein
VPRAYRLSGRDNELALLVILHAGRRITFEDEDDDEDEDDVGERKDAAC